MAAIYWINKRCSVVLLWLLFVAAGLGATAYGQGQAQDRLDALKLQLDEVQEKQLDLQEQLLDLDEQLKPENIESSLAGVGSTRPEDLRELRRRQLERIKSSIQNQLGLLNDSQTRLQAAIGQAEAEAYQESAGVAANKLPEEAQEVSEPKQSQTRERRVQKTPRQRSKRSTTSN